MKKLLFIYNPYAGKGQIKGKLSDVVDIFVKNGYEVTIYPTQDVRDGKRKTIADAAGYDLVVCSGGDGTLNEVVSGMLEANISVPIGYLPMGSTNDFSTSLGIPKNPLDAAKAAVTGDMFYSDVGTLNGRAFVYVAAFGLFADVSYQTKQEMKNIFGHSAYLLEGAKSLANIPSYHLEIEYGDQKLEGDYIYGMISNSLSVGGFKNLTGKNVKLDDGMYEVTLVHTPQNLTQLNEVLGAVISGNLQVGSIDTFKTSGIRIRSTENISWTVDGEYGGTYMDVEIINHKHAAHICIPEISAVAEISDTKAQEQTRIERTGR